MVNNFELIRFVSDLELAKTAAAGWLDAVEAINQGAATYCVALSGGRIARQFFAELASLAKARRASLDRVHFFWSDERCVPPTDPESNFHLAREAFFAPVGIAERQIHRVRGEEAPESAARKAEEELRRIAACDSSGQPILDLILLGMGEDGHVASLFPGELEELMASQAVYRAVKAIKPPPRRVTLGYPAIAAAREAWVLASGPGKEIALRLSVAPNGSTPLARVLKLRKHTRIFTDIAVK